MFQKQIFASLMVACLMLVGSPTHAFSNDPQGKIYIAKSFGDFSNCGPISALMLAKYVNADFMSGNLSNNIDKARRISMGNENQQISNGWWNMRDIKKYLNHMAVEYDEILLRDNLSIEKRKNQIVSVLNQGSVALINVNMNDLPRGSEIGKPYTTFPLFGAAWGHFLVIVGYKEINGKLAFEVHDSYDQAGKNRLFYAHNIVNSINSYNPEVIFVKNTHTMDNLWASASWQDL